MTDLTMPFFILLEMLRPYAGLIALVLVVEVALLALLTLRRPQGGKRALGLAAVLGLIAAVVATLALPPYTHAGLGDLQGAVDWLALIGAALGIGLLVALLLLPPLLLSTGRRHP